MITLIALNRPADAAAVFNSPNRVLPI